MSRKQLHGVVVSNAGDKTVSVLVSRVVRNPRYGKSIKRTKKYLAHHTGDTLEVGQDVTIQESRPLSARKRWTVVHVNTSDEKKA